MTRVSDQERHRRVVEEGSNRKRDLAGHRRVVEAEAAKGRERLEALAAEQGVTGGLPALLVEIWDATLEILRDAVPESTFGLWLEPLKAVGVDAETLYLEAPEGIRAWAERRYSGLIAAALADSGTELTRVSFAAPPFREEASA
jgi:DnaA N-terminal domain